MSKVGNTFVGDQPALPIAGGGTGQTTASTAINALLPSQGGNATKYLTTDGSAASWGAVIGAVAGGVIYENAQTISANYTMTSGKNGHSVGPVTINTGITVSIPSGSRWRID